MVHKKQCKVLAFVKDNGSEDLPAVKGPDDTLEILKIMMQKTIFKLLSNNMLADDPRVHEYLIQLWMDMYEDAELTWCAKRTFPKELVKLVYVDFSEQYDDTRQIPVGGMRSADQDLWSTLHLLWGRLIACRVVAELNNLKEPQEALPKELWTGLHEEIGVFPGRVAELIQAFSGEEVPSFKELLQIICGGTLVQKCTFCDAIMAVTAVYGEVEGRYKSSTAVALMPYMAPAFCCGQGNCKAEMVDKIIPYQKLQIGVFATFDKLWSSRCDYCFKLSEKVHRCSKCLTKSWCSRECQQKDWDEKHKEFCIKDADPRKAKGGAQVRKETGTKGMEEGLEKALMLNKDKPIELQNVLSGVNKLCQHKGRNGKNATKVQATSSDGGEVNRSK